MATRELRADAKGRHTTTYRSLVLLPGGGAVMDAPGIRVVGMFDGVAGLDQAFTDIAGIAADCRFPDCRHDSEPGCAVRVTLESGELSPRRLASWRTPHREMGYELRRKAQRLASEERRRVRAGRLRPARGRAPGPFA